MTIYAAGILCWREKGSDIEVLLVHREYYSDWSFPKGKQDPGELLPETAVREVYEEAGLKVKLGRKLSIIRYLVGDEEKEVHYWASKVPSKATKKQKFKANEEIAKIEWLSSKKALTLLSYDHDRQLLIEALEFHSKKELETRALIVLRHAKATQRSDWKGEEAKRPLLSEGQKHAKALIPVLAAYGPKVLVTSPWKRCRDTVAPYAKWAKKTLVERGQLTERSTKRSPLSTKKVVRHLLGESKSGLICTHRPALPSVLEPLASTASKDLNQQVLDAASLRPGDFVVLRLTLGTKPKVVGVEQCFAAPSE
jgi:8-oxo-dGTP pyrophosphatase MutT (NUDIX family)/phosphohistidine phosphatase SixA